MQFYYFVLMLLVGVYAFLQSGAARALRPRLGGHKANEQRMRSIGFPVFVYKLGAFVLAGALAGLAGYLAACQFGFVNPDILAWHQSGIVLMMVILGGMGRLHGAVLGAFAYVLLARNSFRSGAARRLRQALAVGDGRLDRLDRARFSARHRRVYRYRFAPDFLPATERRAHGRRMTGDEILKVRGLCKNFGGLAAVDDVSLEVRIGELHAVIGPNGAGKTTLINLLSGDLPPSAGSILFRGKRHYDISRQRGAPV